MLILRAGLDAKRCDGLFQLAFDARYLGRELGATLSDRDHCLERLLPMVKSGQLLLQLAKPRMQPVRRIHVEAIQAWPVHLLHDANVVGARRLAERLGPDAVIVTLAVDTAFKYMSVSPFGGDPTA